MRDEYDFSNAVKNPYINLQEQNSELDNLRHELTDRIARLGYNQMLQVRNYMDSFVKYNMQGPSKLLQN